MDYSTNLLRRNFLGNYHGHHGQEGSLEEGAGGVFNINIFYLIYINKERGRNLSLFKI